jgi:hypothetical protein
MFAVLAKPPRSIASRRVTHSPMPPVGFHMDRL